MNREEIERNTIAFLRTAGGTRPDLRLADMGDRKIVIKDFNRSAKLFRLLIGPILIRRERAALARLEDLNTVPHIIEQIDCRALAIDHLEGTALCDYKGEIPEGFFDELKEVVRQFHARGVVHCDLRCAGNVMITADGKPKVVDFAACVLRGLNPLMNFVFGQFAQADLYAIVKLKRKCAPDTLTKEETELLATQMPFEPLAKKIGCAVRNLARRLTAREHEPCD